MRGYGVVPIPSPAQVGILYSVFLPFRHGRHAIVKHLLDFTDMNHTINRHDHGTKPHAPIDISRISVELPQKVALPRL